jgi:hypothetical protein
MSRTPDVVIAGGGIAGSALAAVLARGNVQVAVLEHDLEPVDRVRGEGMAPWGVIELRRLGLYDALVGAGGVLTSLTVPHDENLPGEKALPFTLRFTDLVPEVPGMLCMSHPGGRRGLPARREGHCGDGRCAAANQLQPRRAAHRMDAAPDCGRGRTQLARMPAVGLHAPCRSAAQFARRDAGRGRARLAAGHAGGWHRGAHPFPHSPARRRSGAALSLLRLRRQGRAAGWRRSPARRQR